MCAYVLFKLRLPIGVIDDNIIASSSEDTNQSTDLLATTVAAYIDIKRT